MRWNIYILVIGCWLFSAERIHAQEEVSVKARLDSTTLLIGEQTKLTLSVVTPKAIGVAFPNVVDTLTRAIEVVQQSAIDTAFADGQLLTLKQELLVTSFDSGYHLIPGLSFLALNDNGLVDTIKTNPLALNILLVPVDTSQAIKPIKGLEEAPITIQEMLPWILGILTAIILGLVGFLIYRRYKNRPVEVITKPKPKEPAHIIAFRDLEVLKNEKVWQNGEVKVYHSRLTDIIRAYIEHRYEIPALEQTSDEIFGAFERNGLQQVVPYENLQQLLTLADLVKFAKGKPQPSENDRSMDLAYEFVKRTINEPIPTDATKENEHTESNA